MKRKINDSNEPIAKRTRLQLRQRRETQTLMLRLTDLPVEPLRMIFKQLSTESRCMLADASEELRTEHIEFVQHEYKSFLHYQKNVKRRNPNDSNSVMELNIVKISNDAINYYVSAGHAECLIRAVQKLFKTRYDDVHIWQMERFLQAFYTHLESEPPCDALPSHASERTRLHSLRLLNMVTLLNLLRQFREYHLIESRMNLMHWQVHIEIWGIYISGLNKNWLTPTSSDVDKLNDLATLIAELLAYDMSNVANSHSIFIGEMAYNLGIQKPPLHRSTRLELKFVVLAPVTVRNLLEDVMAGRVPTSTPLNLGPFDAFSIQLDMKTHYAQNARGQWWQICMLSLF